MKPFLGTQIGVIRMTAFSYRHLGYRFARYNIKRMNIWTAQIREPEKMKMRCNTIFIILPGILETEAPGLYHLLYHECLEWDLKTVALQVLHWVLIGG